MIVFSRRSVVTFGNQLFRAWSRLGLGLVPGKSGLPRNSMPRRSGLISVFCSFPVFYGVGLAYAVGDDEERGDEESGSSKSSYLERTRHRIVGNYENRIRKMSNPVKIFDYFASERDDEGKPLMTPDDFVRAITPFGGRDHDLVGNKSPGDYSGSPTIKLKETSHDHTYVPEIFKRLSPAGDGRLRLEEYILLTTLLAIPPDMYEVAFRISDENGDEMLDSSEFRSMMGMMYEHSPISKSQKPKPRNINEFIPAPPGLFGPNLDKSLSVAKFKSVLTQLREEIWRIQFSMMDEHGDGKLSAHTFAAHIISHATRHDSARLERLKEMLSPTSASGCESKNKGEERLCKALKDTEYVYEDWLTFNGMVDDHYELRRAVKLYMARDCHLKKHELKRMVEIVSGYKLSEATLDMLYFLFDEDKSGVLDHEEFLAALEFATGHGLQKQRDLGIGRFIECIRSCRRSSNFRPHRET